MAMKLRGNVREQRLGLARLAAVFMAWTSLVGVGVAQASATTPPGGFAQDVARICSHARLFEGTHAIGTGAGALAVADDIRSTSRRRLAVLTALPVPAVARQTVTTWLRLERRLADSYALNYVRIYDLIATPRATPAEDVQAARRLAKLLHAPDPLRRAAARLEQQLGVPDCTGAGHFA
jgi:hypothetical protein